MYNLSPFKEFDANGSFTLVRFVTPMNKNPRDCSLREVANHFKYSSIAKNSKFSIKYDVTHYRKHFQDTLRFSISRSNFRLHRHDLREKNFGNTKLLRKIEFGNTFRNWSFFLVSIDFIDNEALEILFWINKSKDFFFPS